ncbi:MAG TPA: hypothetical protein VE422_20330 [Terriglobia bacterium]|nr:hypothetical protein [Terriglobia bacterium]
MRKLIVLIGIIVLAGCSSQQPSSTTTEQQPKSAMAGAAKMGQLATDPFAQMSLSFEGNPPAAEIQARMDKVLPLYGLEINNENRTRAGQTLVALRKQYGASEIGVLDNMITTPPSGKFEEAADRIAARLNQ